MPTLPGSALETTSLGFGCSSLSGGSSRRHSVKLIDAAFDAGIRHFDVAPPYGMGTAEDLLGDALGKRRHEVTIATKVGIDRLRQGAAVMWIRSLAAPLRKLAPGLTRRVGASAYTGLTANVQLDQPSVEASLARSLRSLRTDYIDLLLLHEVTLEALTDELLSLLLNLRRRGTVRAFGTGTSYASTLAIRAKYPTFFDVWQYSWTPLDGRPEVFSGFNITHRAIQQSLAPLRSWLQADGNRARRLSDSVGVDLSSTDNLVQVLLGSAMAANPRGVVLASSRQKRRIQENAKVLRDETFITAGRNLMDSLAAQPELVRA